jgi:hypothetical protein
MFGWTFRTWPRQPTFPMTIAGHGRIHTHTLPEQPREHFDDLHPGRREWGVLFVLNGGQRPWTLYSPDPDYTAMSAPAAHQLTLTFELFTEKFPCWNKNWRIG